MPEHHQAKPAGLPGALEACKFVPLTRGTAAAGGRGSYTHDFKRRCYLCLMSGEPAPNFPFTIAAAIHYSL